MKKDKRLIVYLFYISISIFIFFLPKCNDKELEKFIQTFSLEGDQKIDYFYNEIISKKNYNLLENFILDDLNLYDPKNNKGKCWTGSGKKEMIKWIINQQSKYGQFHKYKIIDRRYFYAIDEGTLNIDYTLEVDYQYTKTNEIIILGFMKRKKNELKLIAYTSWIIQ